LAGQITDTVKDLGFQAW